MVKKNQSMENLKSFRSSKFETSYFIFHSLTFFFHDVRERRIKSRTKMDIFHQQKIQVSRRVRGEKKIASQQEEKKRKKELLMDEIDLCVFSSLFL